MISRSLRVSLVPVALTVALAGCGSVGAIGIPLNRDRQARAPQDLTMAAPTQPVDQRALPPLGEPVADAGGPGGLPADPLAPGGAPAAPAEQVAAVDQGREIGRTDLLGGWTVASGGDSCQLFMTLTTWTGGYRASTRGCSSAALTSISAWKLNGNEVVLSAGEGTPVARLYAQGGNRYAGALETGGAPITVSR
jgi:hypothetical protein